MTGPVWIMIACLVAAVVLLSATIVLIVITARKGERSENYDFYPYSTRSRKGPMEIDYDYDDEVRSTPTKRYERHGYKKTKRRRNFQDSNKYN